jgi:hypothetical protein
MYYYYYDEPSPYCLVDIRYVKENIFSGLSILHRVHSKNPIETDDHAVMGVKYNHVLENGYQG